jgi:hypothetical protein
MKMSIRTVQGSPETDIGETIKDDILSHSNDLRYKARFIIASSVDYDYIVTCDEFPTVCKDADYIGRSIIQAKFENRHPSTAMDWFPTPQPFKIVRVPKDQNPQSAA